jgi:predicted MFS family arabinose efflux permease
MPAKARTGRELADSQGLLVGARLTQDFGWRWVFFVNLPIAALVLFGAFRILKADHGRSVPGGFGAVGAVRCGRWSSTSTPSGSRS